MNLGLHLPHIGPMATRDGVLEVARAADAAGIDSLWASDHVIVPRDYASTYPYSPSGKMPIPEDAPFLEAVSTLLAVCGVTRRARLGTSVLVLPQRPARARGQTMGDARRAVRRHERSSAQAPAGWKRSSRRFGVPFKGRGGRCGRGARNPRALLEGIDGGRSTASTSRSTGSRASRSRYSNHARRSGSADTTPAAFRRVARYGDAWHGWRDRGGVPRGDGCGFVPRPRRSAETRA